MTSIKSDQKSISRELYHFPFDPHSRLARLILTEKKLDFKDITIRYWEDNEGFLKLNPSGQLPVLLEISDNGQVLKLCENRALLEHLEEAYTETKLWPSEPQLRAEARRILGTLERRFDLEVNSYLLHEKMEKRLMSLGQPDIGLMRFGREALKSHLQIYDNLLERSGWLVGNALSLADFALAAQLSLHDYFDEIHWSRYNHLKIWYMAMKSRPSFRPLLNERLAGFHPSANYDELDF